MSKKPAKKAKQTKNLPLPDSATNVDDKVFWKALRVPPGAKNAARLAEAIKLGRAGKHAQAYAALADYHRAALAGEWSLVRQSWLKRPAPAAQALRDSFNHKINVWHNQVIQFGPKIDWWPQGQVSDNVHGLHRLHWLAPAVTAFIQTGDRRSRDFIVDILDQFDAAKHHPRWQDIRPMTFNFLEIASKWPLLLAAYLAMASSGDISANIVRQFTRLFLIFGRSLAATMGEFIPGYNAQAVAFTSLLHIARCFPEFVESPAWDRLAVAMVVKHARDGFFADGGNKERVWGYGTMHVSSLAQPYEIARRFGGMGGHEREIVATLRRACQWYAKTVAPPPTHAFPTYGDAGWGAHDRFPTVAAMGACLPESRKPFFGVDRSHGYLLEPSGFAVMRNGDDLKSSYVNVNCGKFAGWHSHWDLLSMNLWAFGQPLLEELCRFGPYANPLDKIFYSPEAHNLTLVDGMIYDCRLVKGEDVQWHSDDKIEYLSAYHRAYRYFVYGHDEMNVSPNMEGKVRRTILMVKDPGYVVVMDSVENMNHADFRLAISQYWHSPAPFKVVGPAAACTEGKTACLVVQARTEGLHRQETTKDFGGEEVAHLGAAYDRYCLRARRWMPINHHGISGFTTVLYPFKGRMPAVTATTVPAAGGKTWKTDAIKVVSPAGTDIIALNPERMADFTVGGKRMAARAHISLGRRRGEIVIK